MTSAARKSKIRFIGASYIHVHSLRIASGQEVLVARVVSDAGRVGYGFSFRLDATEARHMAEWAAGVRAERPPYESQLDHPWERAWLSERMRREHAERAERHGYSLIQALVHGRVWLLALLYFALVCGLYGVSFWIPQIIQGFGGLGDFAVGVVSMVPYLAAAIGMAVGFRLFILAGLATLMVVAALVVLQYVEDLLVRVRERWSSPPT